jgi:hypothetical protein
LHIGLYPADESRTMCALQSPDLGLGERPVHHVRERLAAPQGKRRPQQFPRSSRRTILKFSDARRDVIQEPPRIDAGLIQPQRVGRRAAYIASYDNRRVHRLPPYTGFPERSAKMRDMAAQGIRRSSGVALLRKKPGESLGRD